MIANAGADRGSLRRRGLSFRRSFSFVVLGLCVSCSVTRTADEAGPERDANLVAEGRALAKEGRFFESLAVLDAACRSNAGSLEARKWRAIVLLEIDAGWICFHEFAELAPRAARDPYFTLMHGVFWMRIGVAGRARPLFAKALELDPGLEEARQNLAAVDVVVGETRRQLDELQSAWSGSTEQLLDRAGLQFVLGDWEKTLADLERAVPEEEAGYSQLFQLGSLRAWTGKTERALETFERMREEEDETGPQMGRVLVHCLRGEWREARAALPRVGANVTVHESRETLTRCLDVLAREP